MALTVTDVHRDADLFRPAAEPDDECRCTGCGHPAWLECDCLCCPFAGDIAAPMASSEEGADLT